MKNNGKMYGDGFQKKVYSDNKMNVSSTKLSQTLACYISFDSCLWVKSDRLTKFFVYEQQTWKILETIN